MEKPNYVTGKLDSATIGDNTSTKRKYSSLNFTGLALAIIVLTILHNPLVLIAIIVGAIAMYFAIAYVMRRWAGGVETLASYGCDGAQHEWIANSIPRQHRRFIESTVPFHESDEFIFVHAGHVADIPMSAQPDLALRWRTTSLIAKPHCSGKTVIAGHTAQKSGDILDLGFVKCIDTNCVRGGWLTAVDVSTGEIWQSNIHGAVRVR